MNYEVARELEEAGWPQGGKGTWTYPPDKLVTRSSDRVYVPTLEELIAACGEEFAKLKITPRRVGQLLHCADRRIENGLPSVKVEGRGHTPTEAVARLWLALHKIA
jgi:hypothetical protein